MLCHKCMKLLSTQNSIRKSKNTVSSNYFMALQVVVSAILDVLAVVRYLMIILLALAGNLQSRSTVQACEDLSIFVSHRADEPVYNGNNVGLSFIAEVLQLNIHQGYATVHLDLKIMTATERVNQVTLALTYPDTLNSHSLCFP